jgi:lactoylglutathione lyase
MNSVSLKLLVLKTRQLERVRTFYEALGVSFVEEKHGNGPVHYAGQVGETVLEVYPLAGEGSADGTIRLGFAVENLDQVLERVQSGETQVVTSVVVRDPDGRAVELQGRPGVANG